jgi:hypothetical protein
MQFHESYRLGDKDFSQCTLRKIPVTKAILETLALGQSIIVMGFFFKWVKNPFFNKGEGRGY